MNSNADEKYGTDYEGRINLGGKYFRPLSDFSPLPSETRNRLIQFQSAMPKDAYGFIYVPSSITRKMFDFDNEIVLERYLKGDGPYLTILVILGAKVYGRKKHRVNNLFRQYKINRRFEKTQKAVAQILETSKKILGEPKGFSFELLVVHRNAMDSLLTPFFIMNSMGKSDPQYNGAEGEFYRLR